MKKRVYITESHHHVIKEWSRYKGKGVYLLSFDYHTDFCNAFVRKGGDPAALFAYSKELHNFYLNKHIPCSDIDAAIKDLKNDEHIDFALRSGIIERAFVFSCHSNSFYEGRVLSVPIVSKHCNQCRIFSYSESCHPIVSLPYDDTDKARMAKINTTDEVLTDVMEVFKGHGFDWDNFVLDFDCDFIRDKEAMRYSNVNILEKLIKNAKAITIARESSCVNECSDSKLTSDEIQEWLIGLIKKSCAEGVEVQMEEKRV